MYNVIVNGVGVYSVENSAPAKHENMMVFAGDPWYEAVDGQIRGLVIQSDAA